MKLSQFFPKAQHERRCPRFFILVVIAGLWLAVGDGLTTLSPSHEAAPPGPGRDVSETTKPDGVWKMDFWGGRVREPLVRDNHRQPLQMLGNEEQTIDGRVRHLQEMRGISLSKEERGSALAFLAGKEVPEGMAKASMQWLSDELLTVMRLQEPPSDGLAEDLARAAFQPGTDPIVRDYIMQHLGHLWEQSGFCKEIDDALWRAVASSDETTPGTALIALSRGYERDHQEAYLAKVRQQALELARNPKTGLTVRVTALSIAGDGGGKEVKELAADLVRKNETPVILKKVAERVVR